MPYTHCARCGAKALVGATRCPRCQEPFVSYSVTGERVPTVNCPHCGVQRPVAIGVCPNCLTSPTHAAGRVSRGLTVIGVAIVGIITIGYVVSRTIPPSSSRPAVSGVVPTESATAQDSLRAAALSHDNVAPDTMAAKAMVVPVATVTTSPVTVPTAKPTAPSAVAKSATSAPSAPSAPITAAAKADAKPATHPIAAVSDSGVWVSAVAKTWVRVRSAPSRESEVLRMIDSAQRVQLGPPVFGWRPVRVGVDRGWVDPRLFTVHPATRP